MNSWLIGLIIIWLFTPITGYLIIPYFFYGTKSIKNRIIIVVLGDIGRSPRMCYHATSFADKGFDVEFIGYKDSEIPDCISKERKRSITIHDISYIAVNTKNKSVISIMVTKVFRQTFQLIKILWNLRGSDYILVQNPPSIPILPIACFYKFIFRTKLIIDWHNFGYTILKLKLAKFHPFVIVYFMVEFIFSRFADYHLTVTNAMKDYLIQTFKLPSKKISTLHDRPGPQFKPLPEEDRCMLLSKNPPSFISEYLQKANFKYGKDKILVTSTSFTPDEDLEVLLTGLKIFNQSYAKDTDQNLLCFITGKGPLKPYYQKKVNEMKLEHVKIYFLWLQSEDYPKLLQLCDFGVSLHMSSSGLDLPMKILDMFGSGIPVIAYSYDTLDELVKHGVNGYRFQNPRILAESIGFICNPNNYNTLRTNVLNESKIKWQSSWENSMIKELKIVKQR
ncbi:chitobiosyldiphosphodolichol beta-1,4 mannosyltransferase SCDLUD_000575 [Saccharomycodes ludwigii]|uniref:chitobiosyldiphosphodolichol beta-1,4 mannosyltransferase n=1 Tax=Saccharomycodes ludwigii TaxID=36035 RepID=UPI001E8924E3|nr:hypothetical protein SCDLUD_000575 [Saccharomycodes ludwigii]KAH3902975.1 hypothetical protein SCDLUD_000575 [Saccharomycodes ludwigii]